MSEKIFVNSPDSYFVTIEVSFLANCFMREGSGVLRTGEEVI